LPGKKATSIPVPELKKKRGGGRGGHIPGDWERGEKSTSARKGAISVEKTERIPLKRRKGGRMG